MAASPPIRVRWGMVGLLPLLLLRPFGAYALAMPRPLTALSLGRDGMDGWVPLVAGDAEGTLYAPRAGNPNPIGRVDGRVLALRCFDTLSFVVVYAPPLGEERVELWERDGNVSKRAASLGTLPEGARPLLALGEGTTAFGSVGGRRATLCHGDGKPSGAVVSLPEGVVGLATRWNEREGASLVAALSSGEIASYGIDGAVHWRRALPTRGRLLAFDGSQQSTRAAWASDESGGRTGLVDLSDGGPVGEAVSAPGVVRARALLSDRPLIVGERAVEASRHTEPWTFASPVVAADTGGAQVAVALADGTLVVRTPLTRWIKRGDAALLSP